MVGKYYDSSGEKEIQTNASGISTITGEVDREGCSFSLKENFTFLPGMTDLKKLHELIITFK